MLKNSLHFVLYANFQQKEFDLILDQAFLMTD